SRGGRAGSMRGDKRTLRAATGWRRSRSWRQTLGLGDSWFCTHTAALVVVQRTRARGVREARYHPSTERTHRRDRECSECGRILRQGGGWRGDCPLATLAPHRVSPTLTLLLEVG